MKRSILFLVLLLFTTNYLLCQNIGRDVLAGSGGAVTTAELGLSWTIGQGGLVGTLTKSSLILNQGFEQENDNQFVVIVKIENHEFMIDLFPNPVLGNASLKLTSDVYTSYFWTLYNPKGEIIIQQNNQLLYPGSVIENIPTGNLNPGMYFLQTIINTPDGKQILKTIKIIKN